MLDPDSSIPLIILVVLLFFHAFIAAAREAITSIRRSKRAQLIEEGDVSAQLIDDLNENTALLLATEQLILKTAAFFMVVLAVVIYASPLANFLIISTFAATLLITIGVLLIVLICGELIPKEIARSRSEAVALNLIYPFYWISFIAIPLATSVTAISRILTGRRWDDDTHEVNLSTITEEDLLSYVDEGEEDGVLQESEREMIHSIFELDDTFAREVMVPRIDIIAVEANASIMEAIGLVIQAGHSRVPVYEDTIDKIVGILYVKDLLIYWLDQASQPASVGALKRDAYYVPETKPASELLRELQAKKVHIAIVVDEYGGTAGLVTIEDILEEIVGEIQDEHDADEFYMKVISENEYIFSARMDLDDINDMMSINLPTDESDTLGGLIYNMFGRIPEAGDSLNGETVGLPDLYFTVLGVEGRRIKRVKIQRILEYNSQLEENTETIGEENPSTFMGNVPNTLSESS